MKVFNQDKTEELTIYNLDKGYLIEDEINGIYHEEQQEVPDEFHYEVIREYPNGGREVKKVIDKKGIPYREAYYEKEQILVYIPYTEEELIQNEYYALKNWFNETYRYKFEKYNRLIALNKLDDDEVEPSVKLVALYEEAESNRKRIQELENLLN